MHCMPTLPNFKHNTPNSPRHITVSLLSCLPLLSALSSSLLDIYLPLITSIFFSIIEQFVSKNLQDAGYYTAYFGKVCTSGV
jgi:hypothetical protein